MTLPEFSNTQSDRILIPSTPQDFRHCQLKNTVIAKGTEKIISPATSDVAGKCR